MNTLANKEKIKICVTNIVCTILLYLLKMSMASPMYNYCIIIQAFTVKKIYIYTISLFFTAHWLYWVSQGEKTRPAMRGLSRMPGFRISLKCIWRSNNRRGLPAHQWKGIVVMWSVSMLVWAHLSQHWTLERTARVWGWQNLGNIFSSLQYFT